MANLKKLIVDDLVLKGKNVLVRVDFNVPIDENGAIVDDNRISATITTIKKILSDGGKAILMSHMGRPKGKVVESLRLGVVAKRLSEILKIPVKMAPDCIGPEVEELIRNTNYGECILLENLRFYPEETANDDAFAKKLSRLGDVYINNAFGSAHRAHASVEAITKYFDQCAAGFLMHKELNYLSGVIEKPEKPFIAILGGAKISDKIQVIEKLLYRVDRLLIGGGMMFTFLKAKGFEIGNSLLEEDKLELAIKTIEIAGDKLVLPIDTIVADEFSNTANKKTVPVGGIEPGWMGLDIGPKTIRKYYKCIIEAKTILWNGPMGVFEMDSFAQGTFGVAEAISESTKNGCISIVGGGDSSAAVKKAKLEDHITHISTGGGASLEMLEGKELPGVAALTNKKKL